MASSHELLVRRCTAELERRGVRWKGLTRTHGLDLDQPAVPGARVPACVEQALLRDAERLCDDPFLGWELGVIEFRSLGLFGYSVLNEPSVGAALTRLIELSALVTEASHLALNMDASEARLTQSQPTNAVTSQVCLRMLLCHMAELVGPEFRPLRLGICNQSPMRLRGLCDRAGAAVEGTEGEITFVAFPTSMLGRPLHGADALLARTLQPLWTEECAKLAARGAGLQRIRDAILPLLPMGMPTPDRVAVELGMSRGTLRDALDDLGSNLPQIVDCIRSHLVADLLARPETTLAEVARLVGMPDERDFARAYRRWFGEPPKRGKALGTRSAAS